MRLVKSLAAIGVVIGAVWWCSCVRLQKGVAIVSGGKACAVIVIPDAPLPVVKVAAEELQYHVRKATGATLPIVSESRQPAAGSVISIGATRMAEVAGLKAMPMTPNSFTIKLTGETLYFVGDDSKGDPFRDMQHNRTRVGTLFAVYEFLAKQVGVRWLWPGELGEMIPRSRDISADAWDYSGQPAMLHTRWRTGLSAEAGWSSAKARDKFICEQDKWLRRHRFALAVNMDVCHSFTHWWKEYGTTKPEFFNLLPDGTRRPDPYYYGGNARLIAMCVAEPSLPKEIVERFVSTRKWKPGQPLYIDASENDTDGKCVCDRCLAWDVPDPDSTVPFDQRKAKAAELFKQDKPGWEKLLGSLSDRYCRFWLAVQKEAQKIDPNAVVMFHGYANYRKPPLQTRLNDRMINSFVPGFLFPWTEKAKRQFRSDWLGWRGAGCSMMLRPNYLDCGHNMPIFYARKFGADFNFAWNNGMIATDYDALPGQYAVQGPNLYVVARLNNNPAMPAHLALDEYYAGFGNARKAVAAYFRHWEKVSDALTDEGFKKENIRGDVAYGQFYLAAPEIFNARVMAEARRLLADATESAKGNAAAGARVAFLEKGLRNVELTLEAQAAYETYRSDQNIPSFAAAIDKLDAYRAAVEGDNIGNMNWLRHWENVNWDRTLIRTMAHQPGQRLEGPWRFMWDPEKSGENQGWQRPEFDDTQWYHITTEGAWEQQSVGRKWAETHGAAGYDGLAWYRTRFPLAAGEQAKQVRLLFGAVDEACVVWLNGQKVLTRPYPFQGNPDSWQEAFDLDVTPAVRFGATNTLVVRVEDNAGDGGIWRPVWLLVCDPPAGAEENCVRNTGFEDNKTGVPWKTDVRCGKFTFAVDGKTAHSGNRSGRVVCTMADQSPEMFQKNHASAWGRWYQTVEVNPGRKYRFRCFVLTSKKFSGRVTVFLTGDRELQTRTDALLNTQGRWRELIIDGYVAANATAGILLNVYDSTGSVWFDDIELTQR